MTPALVASIRACQGCGACLLTCPARAIRPLGGRLVVLAACDGCGECVEVCPVDAIDLVTRVHAVDPVRAVDAVDPVRPVDSVDVVPEGAP